MKEKTQKDYKCQKLGSIAAEKHFFLDRDFAFVVRKQ